MFIKDEKLKLFYSIYNNLISPILYFYTENEELYSIEWIINENYKKNVAGFINKKWDYFERELKLYFDGKLKVFNIKLYSHNYSNFTRSVLEELKSIPYGETLNYKNIAESIKNPKAVRAVGSACRRNYFPIVIPCHRVVSVNGLGGYMGRNTDSKELEIKKKLLKLEKR